LRRGISLSAQILIAVEPPFSAVATMLRINVSSTVAKQMAEGELSPDEAAAVGTVIDLKRRAIEVELEQRLRVLEERLPK
jgi:hypothetical protein